MVVVINGKTVDFGRLPPAFRQPMADWPAGALADLETLGVRYSSDAGARMTVTESIAVIYFLGRKVNRALSIEDVRALTLTEINNVMAGIDWLLPSEPAAADTEESPGASPSPLAST